MLYVDNKTANTVSNYDQIQSSTGNTAGQVSNASNSIIFTMGNSNRTDANLVTNVNDPTSNTDAVHKIYVRYSSELCDNIFFKFSSVFCFNIWSVQYLGSNKLRYSSFERN